MEATLAVHDIFYVEVLTKLQLQSVEPGKTGAKVLQPGEHKFYNVVYSDGRPKKEWAVLVDDPSFGTPDERLRSLDRLTKGGLGPIEVTDIKGRPYYA